MSCSVRIVHTFKIFAKNLTNLMTMTEPCAEIKQNEAKKFFLKNGLLMMLWKYFKSKQEYFARIH